MGKQSLSTLKFNTQIHVAHFRRALDEEQNDKSYSKYKITDDWGKISIQHTLTHLREKFQFISMNKVCDWYRIVISYYGIKLCTVVIFIACLYSFRQWPKSNYLLTRRAGELNACHSAEYLVTLNELIYSLSVSQSLSLHIFSYFFFLYYIFRVHSIHILAYS